MPWCTTTHFGRLEYTVASTIHFSEGMPGFESKREFVVVQQPQHHPLVFLQSLDAPGLCFPALPVRAVEAEYEPCIADTDLELLGFVSQPRIGEDVIILALIAIHEDDPTANLLAPIVINLHTRTAAQCIDSEMRYSHRYPFGRSFGGRIMMVMRRREGEKILIGDNISIHIAHIGRNKVKIAIEAPREIPILAEEMRVVRDENVAAASVNGVLRSKIFPQTSQIPSDM